MTKDTFFRTKISLNCRGTLRQWNRPLVMGILNVGPDSFYDGGRYVQAEAALKQTERMLKEGADIIDIGAVSTKPGAEIPETGEEMRRLMPVLEALMQAFPGILVSVDTFRSAVAQAALQAGASIINDVYAGRFDPGILTAAAEHHAPLILMHMQGDPHHMQDHPQYDNVVSEVLQFLARQALLARQAGVDDIIIDPGFGFGKSRDHNFELLSGLGHFVASPYPVLAGMSRKSMINQTLGIKAADALNGTSVLNTVALMKGASLIRVHDVKEAVQAIRLLSNL